MDAVDLRSRGQIDKRSSDSKAVPGADHRRERTFPRLRIRVLGGKRTDPAALGKAQGGLERPLTREVAGVGCVRIVHSRRT